jgi:hypothetical protein
MEWLSHDYENGGGGEVVDISAVQLCAPILLGEVSKIN